MKRLFLTLMLGLLALTQAMADYTDIPYDVNNGQFTVDNYTFSNKTGYYQEWDHYVIFWSTGYGSNSSSASTIGSGNYLLNLSEMKTYAEKCFDSYTALGFLNPTDFGHKIIILAYYSTDWFATGSGYGEYGVLNISHASADPSANYYTYCHEIAHAYQYLGNMKNGGNAGFQYGEYYGYVSYYENCGNWQANQIYKNLYFGQLSPVYIKTTNLAFLNSWHCYQSYPMNDYFTEKRSHDAVGKIWTVNTNTKYADAPEKYMNIYNLSANDMYKEFFWAAMRITTWDLTAWDSYLSAAGRDRDFYMDHTPGTKASNYTASSASSPSDMSYLHCSTYQYVTLNSSNAIHQVAYSSCPQSTGFNIIKLNVPTGSNRKVTTTFTALPTGSSLASGDNKEYWTGAAWAKANVSNYNSSQTEECNSNYNTFKQWRGFRLGYVTYNKSTGERHYNYTDEVFCTGTDESSVNVQFDVPENVDSLYLIVSPALSNYLRMGSVNPYEISNDDGYLNAQKSMDQWPYKVQFYNTNIYGLSNPSTTFSGTAKTGTTYTSSSLPDMGDGQGESGESSETGKTTSATISKDVTIDATDGSTTSTTFTLSTAELAELASDFGIDASTLAMTALTGFSDYAETQNANTIMFMPATPDCQLSTGSSNCTDNTYKYGHWFNQSGNVTNAGSSDAALYSKFSTSTFAFNIGETVGKNGQYTICQALRYYDGTNYSIVYLKFNVTVKATPTTLEINKSISFAPDAEDFSGDSIVLSDEDMASIATLFGVSSDYITNSNNWEAWNANGLSEGKISLRGVESDGTTIKDTLSTANGYGYWFNTIDNVCGYGNNNCLFTEYSESKKLFNIGQAPGVVASGDNHTITVAIIYQSNNVTYAAYIHFNVSIQNATNLNKVLSDKDVKIESIYNALGQKMQTLQKGINFIKLSNGEVKKIRIRE